MPSEDKTRIKLPQTVCSKSLTPSPEIRHQYTQYPLILSLPNSFPSTDRMVLLLRSVSDFPYVSCSHFFGTNGLCLFLSLYLSQYTNAFIHTSVVDYGPQYVHNSQYPHYCGVQHPFWFWAWPWGGFGKYVNHRCYISRILRCVHALEFVVSPVLQNLRRPQGESSLLEDETRGIRHKLPGWGSIDQPACLGSPVPAKLLTDQKSAKLTHTKRIT